MTQPNLQETAHEMEQLDIGRPSDANYPPVLTVAELYGCLCHRPVDRLPARDSTADQD